MQSEYKIKFTGDVTGLETQIKQKLGGLLKEIGENEIVIKFDVGQSITDLKKKIEDVMSAVPNIQLQFKYDTFKKMLEDARADLEKISKIDFDFKSSRTNIKKHLNDIKDDYEETFRQIYSGVKNGEITPKDRDYNQKKEDYKEARNQLIKLQQEIVNYMGAGGNLSELGEDVEKFYNTYKNLFKDLKPAQVIDTNAIEEARQRVETLKDIVEDLRMRLGENIKTTSGNGGLAGVSPEQLNELIKLFKELKDAILSIKDAVGEVNQSSFGTLLQSVEELAYRLDAISEKAGNIKVTKVYNNNGLTSEEKELDVYISKQLRAYEKQYQKFFDTKKNRALTYDNVFAALASTESVGAQFGYDPNEIMKLYGTSAIKSTGDNEKQIRRIIDFLNLVNSAVEEVGNVAADDRVWSELISVNNSIRAKRDTTSLDKKIKDVFDISNKNKTEEEFNSLEEIYRKLIEIKGVLEELADKNVFSEFVDMGTNAFNSFIDKIDELIEKLGILNKGGEGSTNIGIDGKELANAFEQEKDAINGAVNEESTSISSLIPILQNVIDLVNQKTDAFATESSVVKSSIDDEVKYIEELLKVLKEINDTDGFKGFDLGNIDTKQYEKFFKLFDEDKFSDSIAQIVDWLALFVDEVNKFNVDFDNIYKKFKPLIDLSKELKGLNKTLNSKGAKSIINNAKVDDSLLESREITETYRCLQAAYDKLTSISKDKYPLPLEGRFEELTLDAQILLEDFKEMQHIDISNIGNISKETITKFKNLSSEIRNFVGGLSSQDMLASKNSIEKLVTKINSTMFKNSSMGDNLKSQFQGLLDKLGTGDLSKREVADVATEFQRLQTIMYQTGQTGKSMGATIMERLKGVNAQLIAQYMSWQDITRYMRHVITTITEMDTALTEMWKVSDESKGTLEAYQKGLFDVAGNIGTTAKDLTNATADWLRLGETLSEASESAKQSTILLNVSEFESISEATDSLVSMSQAYKNLSKAEIIDVMNNIGNNFSISTDQLSMALQNAAAVLSTQGNDLYEATALITAGNAITQDYSKTAGGVRTIALRLAGTEEAKAELEELGEEVEDFIVQTNSKTASTIANFTKTASNPRGVQVLDDNGNLRNTYNILLDISKVYKQIQEDDKKFGTNRASALVEYIAGKNRSNIAASILENPELLEDVYNKALNSQGSAEEELGKYLDSIDGKTKKLTNTFSELETSLIDKETIKSILDFANNFLKIIADITSALGGLKGIIAGGIGAVLAKKNLGVFDFKNTVSGIWGKNNNLKNFAGLDKDSFGFIDAFKSEAVDDYQAAFDRYIKTANENVKGYITQTNLADISTQDFIDTQNSLLLQSAATDKSWGNVSSLIGEYNSNCENVKLSQEQFTQAISNSNPVLHKYLTNLNGAQATMKGYLGAAFKNTASNLAKSFGNMLLSGVMSMGVTTAITAGISLIKKAGEGLSRALESQGKKAKRNYDFWAEVSDVVNQKLSESESKLEDVNKQIDEINSKGAITITDQNQLILLQQEKTQLESIIELQEEYQRGVNQGKYNAALKYYNANYDGMNLKDYADNIGSGAYEILGKTGESYSPYGSHSMYEYFDMLGGILEYDNDETIYKEYLNVVQQLVDMSKLLDPDSNEKRLVDAALVGFEDTVSHYKYGKNYESVKGNGKLQELLTKLESDNVSNRASLGFLSGLSNEELDKFINNYDTFLNSLEDANKKSAFEVSSQWEQTLNKITSQSPELKNSRISDMTSSLLVEPAKKAWRDYFGSLSASEFEDAYQLFLSGVNINSITTKEFDKKLTERRNGTEGGNLLAGLIGDGTTDFAKTIDDYANKIKLLREGLNNVKYGDGTVSDDLYALFPELYGAKTPKQLSEKMSELLDKAIQDATSYADSSTASIPYVDKDLKSYLDAKGIAADITNTFEKVWNSDSFSDAKAELIELANAGEITEGVLISNAKYNRLMDETGMTAYEVKNMILSLIDGFDKLNIAKKNIDQLGEAFDEFKENGFVAIDTIKGLPQAFHNLGSFDLFSKIIGDKNSTEQEVKDAFNRILTEYLNTELTITDITKRTKDFYITQMKEMGIANAEEIANEYLIRSEYLQQLLDAYAKFTKDKATNETTFENWLSNNSSKLYKNLSTFYGKDASNYIKSVENKMTATGQWTKYYAEAMSMVANANGMAAADKEAFSAAYAERKMKEAINALNDDYKPLTFSLDTSLKSSSSSSSSSSSAKETFDWIEVLIERVERSITILGKRVASVWQSWSTRNTNLADEMRLVRYEINAQAKAAQTYLEYADKVGLSAVYKARVQSGDYRIDDVDSETADKINAYKEYYEKYLAALDKQYDLQDDLAAGTQTLFDNISKEYEERISLVEHNMSSINESIKQIETSGYVVSQKMYSSLIEEERFNISILTEEYNKLLQTRNAVPAYTEQWYEMTSAINSIASAIQQANTSILEYEKNIRELQRAQFDLTREYINGIIDESNFVNDVLGNELYEENGMWNNKADASAFLHNVNYDVYLSQAEAYRDEIAKVNKEIAKDPYNKELIDRRNELLKLQRDAIKNTKEEKEAIVKLYSDGYEKMLSYLKELSDEYMKVLNAEKSMYDYERSISEKAANVTKYTKILSAYNNDDSEESRAAIQRYNEQLKNAEQELQDAQYERWLTDQQTMLDNLYNDTQDWINIRLDDIDLLFQESVDNSNLNAQSIENTIATETGNLGYTITSYLGEIFNSQNGSAVTGYLYSTVNSLSGIYTVIGNISTLVANLPKSIATSLSNPGSTNTNQDTPMGTTSAPAPSSNTGYTPSGSSNSGSSGGSSNSSSSGGGSNSGSSGGGSNTTPNSSPTTSSRGDGVAKVGDKVTYKSGRYYGNSYGGGNWGMMYQGKEVYITSINPKGTKPYHISTGNKLGSGDLGWLTLEQLEGYAKGGQNIKDLLAWTQEQGGEIVRTKDGALLTPVKGGTVFNAAQTEALWNVSKALTVPMNSRIPTNSSATQNVGLSINIDKVVADNPEQFVSQLKIQLKTNEKVQKMVQELTLGQAMGNNKLSINKYR